MKMKAALKNPLSEGVTLKDLKYGIIRERTEEEMDKSEHLFIHERILGT